MNPAASTEERARFDRILERVLDSLPEDIHELLEEIPVIVEDEPTRQMLIDAGIPTPSGEPADLCGLHGGIPLTERSFFESGPDLDRILIFRGPILRISGDDPNELENQIRITLLHEIGHHFGWDEEDLESLGFG